MYQNIMEEEKEDKKTGVLSNVFSVKNLGMYIISFLLSMVNLGGAFSIFSISILGASFASNVPALGIMFVSLIGTGIKYGISGVVEYFLTALILLVILGVVKPRYNEKEKNEKIKIGKHIFVSILLFQTIKLIMSSSFTMYDMLASIAISIIGLVFYKIFVNSTSVLQDFWEQRAYTVEELIGASLMIAISLGALGDINILGFGIKNILSILLVMILGWKNGILVGTTSGVTIGVTMGVITASEPIMIAAYAISGMMAGIFSKFGRIGVVVGFALGNVVLAYVSNGYTIELIHFKEILIASIGLLFVPKNFEIELEEFIGRTKFLPVTPNGTLTRSKEVAENLNQVSQAIQKMATAYKNVEPETKNENKQIFIIELLNNLEPYKENMLYHDVANIDGKIIERIFEYLLENQEIDRKALLKIFADCNSYIIDFDDEDIGKRLEEDISEIIRTINVSYRVAKSRFIWEKKAKENKKIVEKQLNGVSKAIQKMAKGIEKNIENEGQYEKQKQKIIELLKQKSIQIQDVSIKKSGRYIFEIYTKQEMEESKIEQIEKVLTKLFKEKIVLNDRFSTKTSLNFISDDKYVMAIAQEQSIKSKSEESGDCILNVRLRDGKYLVALSDGMGSGVEAKKSSDSALKMLEELLQSGFDKETSLDLINSALLGRNLENFATLDIAIIDLYLGQIEFIKSGACPTYIKNNRRVQIIKSNSLPTGMLENKDIQVFDKDIENNDILLMCTDGILDANIEYKNKELWVKYMLEDIETTNTNKIANLIINEAVDNNFGTIKDDMSIIVCKFKNRD